MNSAANTAALSRSAAQFLVERAERQTGSRMAAYEKVATAVGTTSQWLRKFINGTEAKEPKWTIGWNLIDQYNKVCARVEQELELERSRIETLKREIDAAISPFNQVVASAEGAQAPGTEERQ